MSLSHCWVDIPRDRHTSSSQAYWHIFAGSCSVHCIHQCLLIESMESTGDLWYSETASFDFCQAKVYAKYSTYTQRITNYPSLQRKEKKEYSETPIKESANEWQNVIIVRIGARYIGALYHTLYCYWAEEYRSLHGNLRYIDVRYIEAPLYYQNMTSKERSFILREIWDWAPREMTSHTLTVASRSVVSRITKTTVATWRITTVMLTAAVVCSALVFVCC